MAALEHFGWKHSPNHLGVKNLTWKFNFGTQVLNQAHSAMLDDCAPIFT